MSDADPTPDDLLVSAVLDGVASDDEVQRLTADPGLSARLAAFRAVGDAVRGPVPLVDADVREAHLARALAEARPAAPAAGPAPHPAPPPPPPAQPIDLAAARSARSRPVAATILSIAAAVLLVVGAGAVLLRVSDSTGGSDDTASSSADSGERSADGSADGDAQAVVPEAGAGAADPEREAADEFSSDQAPAAGTVDPSLRTLGTFARAEDLAARVRGELVLDPTPADLAEDLADDACLDDFGVEVALLGRATVAGDEGLVYVEAAPRTVRRLWLVDPTTVGTDGTCREVVAVQTI